MYHINTSAYTRYLFHEKSPASKLTTTTTYKSDPNQFIETRESNSLSDSGIQYSNYNSINFYNFKLKKYSNLFGFGNFIHTIKCINKSYKLKEPNETERYFDILEILNELVITNESIDEVQTVTKCIANESSFITRSYSLPLSMSNLLFNLNGKKHNVYVLYKNNIIHIYTNSIQELYYFIDLRKQKINFREPSIQYNKKPKYQTNNFQIKIYEPNKYNIFTKSPRIKCYAMCKLTKEDDSEIYFKFLRMLDNTIHYNPDIKYRSIEVESKSKEIINIPENMILISFVNDKKHAYLYIKNNTLYIYTKRMQLYDELISYI